MDLTFKGVLSIEPILVQSVLFSSIGFLRLAVRHEILPSVLEVPSTLLSAPFELDVAKFYTIFVVLFAFCGMWIFTEPLKAAITIVYRPFFGPFKVPETSVK